MGREQAGGPAICPRASLVPSFAHAQVQPDRPKIPFGASELMVGGAADGDMRNAQIQVAPLWSRFIGESQIRSRNGGKNPDPRQIGAVADQWDDLMATCHAHLHSALSVVEDLSVHPRASLSDIYSYEQVSGHVWVALVCLAQCGPDGTWPGAD